MMCVNKNFQIFLIFFHAFFSAGFLGKIRAAISGGKMPGSGRPEFQKMLLSAAAMTRAVSSISTPAWATERKPDSNCEGAK